MRSKLSGTKYFLKKLRKKYTTQWTLGGVFVLCMLLGVSYFLLPKGVDAVTNYMGIQFGDKPGSGACPSGGADDGSNQYVTALGSWSSWFGDADNYDPDCARIYLGNMSIPADTDIRIGLQARDINTPCGFLWLFRCGDGGGTIRYTGWVNDYAGRDFFNGWTSWTGDADLWDADQYRFIIETRQNAASYGYTVGNMKLGVELGNVASNGKGCTGETSNATKYTASSTVGGWSGWQFDDGTNENFNCMRLNLIATSTLNSPTATFTGTTTAPANDSINLDYDVEYISTTAGCSLAGYTTNFATKLDASTTITTNGAGSITTVPITQAVTYLLSCTGFKPNTKVTATRTISPFSNPPVMSFTMSPTTGLAIGDTTTATISVTNAASCEIASRDTSGAIVDATSTYPITYTQQTITSAGTPKVIYITDVSSTSWKVPQDWNSSDNSIEAIGGGGAGGKQKNSSPAGGGGGGGGGYAKGVNVTLTPSSSVTISVGQGGTGATHVGEDTWFKGATCGVASVCAKGGGAGYTGSVGGAGGTTTTARGGVGGGVTSPGAPYAYAGGDGGDVKGGWGGAAGGGAGGPSGKGGAGGDCNGNGGAGGGGANGGANGGGCGSLSAGSGGAGSNGGGAGGKGATGFSGCCTASNGTSGSAGTYWGGSKGPGGGGGGGADNTTTSSTVGSGGLYGGGGGGDGDDSSCCSSSTSSLTGVGAQGILVITYTPDVVTDADNTDVRTFDFTLSKTTKYTAVCTPLDNSGKIGSTIQINAPGCLLNGVTIPNGGSDNFWTVSSPSTGHTCSQYGPRVRTCTNGVLDTTNPTYQYKCVDQSDIYIRANGETTTSVRVGSTTAISWNGGNADSCTVTGTDGWSAAVNGETAIVATTSVTVRKKTIYTAQCTYGSSVKKASVTVNVLPTFINF